MCDGCLFCKTRAKTSDFFTKPMQKTSDFFTKNLRRCDFIQITMPRYGKKTDMEVLEPMMWEKEARHI